MYAHNTCLLLTVVTWSPQASPQQYTSSSRDYCLKIPYADNSVLKHYKTNVIWLWENLVLSTFIASKMITPQLVLRCTIGLGRRKHTNYAGTSYLCIVLHNVGVNSHIEANTPPWFLNESFAQGSIIVELILLNLIINSEHYSWLCTQYFKGQERNTFNTDTWQRSWVHTEMFHSRHHSTSDISELLQPQSCRTPLNQVTTDIAVLLPGFAQIIWKPYVESNIRCSTCQLHPAAVQSTNLRLSHKLFTWRAVMVKVTGNCQSAYANIKRKSWSSSGMQQPTM